MNKFKNILDKEFLKNLSVLVTGTAVAQLMTFIFMPVLTRMYSPEAFGVYSVFLAVLMVLTPISNLRYDQAIMLPDEDSKASDLLQLSCWISLALAVLIGILLILFPKQIGQSCGLDFSQFNKWLIPFSVISIGISQALTMWLIRQSRYKAVSINKVAQKFTEGLSGVTLGKSGSITGLILADVIGRFMQLIVSIIQVIQAGFKQPLAGIINLKHALQTYKKFPLTNAIPAVLGSLSLSIPVFIIAHFFSETETGYFNLTRQVLSLPLAFIARSTSQVLLQRISSQFRAKQAILPELKRTAIFLFGIIVPFTLLIQFFAPILFSFIFGEQWSASGMYASILVIAFSLRFVVSPLSVTFTAIHKIHIASIWQTVYFGLMLLLFLTGIFEWTMTELLIAFLSIDLFAYLIYIFLIFKFAAAADRQLN